MRRDFADAELGGAHVEDAEKQTPQGYGSALTYCRRYSLLAACGIPPEEALDDDATRSEADTSKKETRIGKKQIR